MPVVTTAQVRTVAEACLACSLQVAQYRNVSDVSALVLSVVAIVVSIISAVFAGVAAVATRGLHKVERDRRFEERRPRFAATVRRTGAGAGELDVTLLSNERIGGIELLIPVIALKFQGVRFRTGEHGVISADRAEFRSPWGPGRRLTLPVTIGDAYTSPLRLEVTC